MPNLTTDDLLRLLHEPLVLSQRQLLREREFRAEAKRRGFDPPVLDPLADLHRDGVLTPFLGLRWTERVRRAARAASDLDRRSLFGWLPVDAPSLLAGIAASTWTLEPAPPFQSPKQRRRVIGDVGYRSIEYLYSPYQLLQLPAVQEYRASPARGPRLGDWTGRLRALAQRGDAENRHLAAILTRLEPYFYPFIRRRLRGLTSYGDLGEIDRLVAAFDVAQAQSALAFDPEQLRKQAESFLWTADQRDPLRDWLELVAEVGPEHWEKLRGEALLAVDFRIAAEILLRYIEELATKGLAEPLPEIPRLASHPLNERLSPRRADLDEILTKYDLSPHPSLVLVLEGTSEMEVVPKAMRALGIPLRDSFIKLVNRGGVTKQLELLARYIVPSLRRFGNDSAELLRPPTRLMVVTDAEPPYATAASRAALRGDLARHVWNALEAEFQTPTALKDIEDLIEVATWRDRRRASFEFVHFTDRQIATAIIRTGRAPANADATRLAAKIASLRRGGGNLKSIWSGWPKPQPDKPLIWIYLWPILARRIDRLGPAARERVPIVRVLEHARDQATGPRSNLLLRV